MSQWISSVINENSVNRVATALGMINDGTGKSYGPCPVCNAKKRSSKKGTKRLPIGVVRTGGKEYWRCFAGGCDARGDVVDLVSFSLLGVRFGEAKDTKPVREWFSVTNFATVETQFSIEEKEYPPFDEIRKLAKLLQTHSIQKVNNWMINDWLIVQRGLDPELIRGAAIFPDKFPYDELTRVPTSKGGKMHWWPSFWANKYPLMIPMYDVTGTVRSFEGRAVLDNVSPKSMCPAFYSMMNLFFANNSMLRHLRREEEFSEFWFVEGGMDTLALGSLVGAPVMGIKAGSIGALEHIKFPKDAKFVIATHNDDVGDKYAKAIGEYLTDHQFQRLNLGDEDINDFIKRNKGVGNLREMITPSDFGDNIRGKKGIRILRDAFEILKACPKEERGRHLAELRNNIDFLGHAIDHHPVDSENYFQNLRLIRGMAKQIDGIKTRAQAVVKKINIEKNALEPDFVGPHPDVEKRMLRKEIREFGQVIDGGYMNVERNIITILEYDPRIQGKIKYNELKDATEYEGQTICSSAVIDVMLFIQDNYDGFRMEQSIIGNCMNYVAEKTENRYHPAREMMQEIYDTVDVSFAPHKTDPEDLFLYYFRAETGGDPKKEELYRAYAKYFLLGVIGRTFIPGYRMEAFPVLIGKQGICKSSAIRTMALNEDFFSDSFLDIRKKDAFLKIKGHMLYEIAEGEALSAGKASHQLIKGFLSANFYDYRKPYKSSVERVPNSHVFLITTNEEQIDFLSDKTGSRRFHAINVGVGGDIRINELENDMKYIWAKAMHMFFGTGPYEEEGEQKGYFLDKELERYGQKCNLKFAEIDPWSIHIDAFIYECWKNWAAHYIVYESNDPKRREFNMLDLFELLEIQKDRQDRRAAKRLEEIVSRIDCETKKRRIGSRVVKVFRIPQKAFDINQMSMELAKKIVANEHRNVI